MTPHSVANPAFWRAYWVTLRPYLFFVSGASGLLGLCLLPDPPFARAGLAFAAFFVAYGLGQALTDVFQTDTDALSSPYRPLVRGEVTRASVLGVSLLGLGLCAAVFAWLNPWTLTFSAAAVAGLLAYTPFKRRFWGGPPWNAAIVALLPPMGLLCRGSSPAQALANPLLLAACASVFFSYAVFVLLGYLKDVGADRATGYLTLPVRFGRPAAVVASAGCALAAIAASLALVRATLSLAVVQIPAVALWAGGLLFLAQAHLRARHVRRDEEAHPAIALSVRGYVALHLGEAGLLQPMLALPGVALLGLLELALAVRPSRSQI